MEGFKIAFLLSIFGCLGMLNFIEGNCSFPESLEGDWRSSNDAKLSFRYGVLKEYKLNIRNLPYDDFECIKSYTDGNNNRYLLRAMSLYNIFGIKIFLYMCIEIKQDDDIKKNGIHVKKYAIDTNENSMLHERVFAKWSELKNLPTEEDVCNVIGQGGTPMIKLESNDVATKETEKKQIDMKRLLDLLKGKLQKTEDIGNTN